MDELQSNKTLREELFCIRLDPAIQVVEFDKDLNALSIEEKPLAPKSNLLYVYFFMIIQ
jgi:dTDP-glucose pyrophosphorylase